MLTYYDYRGVRVTARWIAVEGRRYLVRDVGGLRITRGPANRVAFRVLGTGGSLLGIAVLLSPALPPTSTALLGLGGFAVVGAAAVIGRAKPRAQVLWLDIRGEEIPIVETTDPIELGKLTRALRRAIERHDIRPPTARGTLTPAA